MFLDPTPACLPYRTAVLCCSTGKLCAQPSCASPSLLSWAELVIPLPGSRCHTAHLSLHHHQVLLPLCWLLPPGDEGKGKYDCFSAFATKRKEEKGRKDKERREQEKRKREERKARENKYPWNNCPKLHTSPCGFPCFSVWEFIKQMMFIWAAAFPCPPWGQGDTRYDEERTGIGIWSLWFSLQDLAPYLTHRAKEPPFPKKFVFEYSVAMPVLLGCMYSSVIMWCL